MRWLDVAGPPGVGKSTLCDAMWPPHAIEWRGEGLRPEWMPFLDCVARLLRRIESHPSYRACESMMQRSIHKMAAVSHRTDDGIYIQTAFAQRGLGIGWRLDDCAAIAEYFELMPVSVGVVLLYADVATIKRRNVSRGKDRSHMVEGMERPRELGAQVLKRRGVSVLELDTRNPISENLRRITAFAGGA